MAQPYLPLQPGQKIRRYNKAGDQAKLRVIQPEVPEQRKQYYQLSSRILKRSYIAKHWATTFPYSNQSLTPTIVAHRYQLPGQ